MEMHIQVEWLDPNRFTAKFIYFLWLRNVLWCFRWILNERKNDFVTAFSLMLFSQQFVQFRSDFIVEKWFGIWLSYLNMEIPLNDLSKMDGLCKSSQHFLKSFHYLKFTRQDTGTWECMFLNLYLKWICEQILPIFLF